MSYRRLQFRLWMLSVALIVPVAAISPPPIKNKTTIILHTDKKTWNEAKLVCESKGQKLLDITYYSIFKIVEEMALSSPWVGLNVGNGPPKWISLHRRVTPLEDEFYSLGCQRLTDFNVFYWGDATPYTPDGDPNTFCVYHETKVDLIAGVLIPKTDYTMANCSEKQQFYCQKEEGPCPFDVHEDMHGDTATDFTPSNDIYLPLDTLDECKLRCYLESRLYKTTNYLTEECWGFTITADQCILHLVLSPTFFDIGNKVLSFGAKLYVKKCFYSDVDTSVYDVGEHTSFYPNSTCGTSIMENSTVSTGDVFVYPGTSTWNEGLQTCWDNGQQLLDIKSVDMYSAIRNLIKMYPALGTTGGIWLGYHKPDPENYTNIWVWSDCTESTVPLNWEPDFKPLDDVIDDILCVVLDTSSLKWKPAKCQENHSFVCVQDNITGNTVYDAGVSYTVGDGFSLGPYAYDYSECSSACSNWAYKGEDCRAFAHRYSTDDGDICHLYYASSYTYYQTKIKGSAENFTFYRKLYWKDYEVTIPPTVTDASLYPYSCCDVSQINYIPNCPANTVPSLEPAIPTTRITIFTLYTQPRTWNEAQQVCQRGGGNLVRIDGVSKRLVLSSYLSSWQTAGHISNTSLLWSGLILGKPEDACSYRWTDACKTPDWVALQTGSNITDPTRLCGALDFDVNHMMSQCSESLPYICELKSNAPCIMDEYLYDTNCLMEIQGEFSSHPTGTCDDICLNSTKSNKECWTAFELDMTQCACLYYVDPFYCKKKKTTFPNRNPRFKKCYSADVEDDIIVVTADSSLLPVADCFRSFPFPYPKDPGRCPQSSTTSSTSTSTSTEAQTTTTRFATSSLQTNTTNSISILSSTSTADLVTGTDSTETYPSEARSVPTPVQTVVPISVAASIVVPLNTLPQAVQEENFTEPIFLWPCTCNTASENKMTVEQWTEWFSKTQSIAKNNTSKYKRGLISAGDGRSSAASVGVVAAITLTIFAVLIILLDVPKIIRNLRGEFILKN